MKLNCTIDYAHEIYEHVTQNVCQSAVREHLAKYVKYKASLFNFSQDSPTEVTRAWILAQNSSKHAV